MMAASFACENGWHRGPLCPATTAPQTNGEHDVADATWSIALGGRNSDHSRAARAANVLL